MFVCVCVCVCVRVCVFRVCVCVRNFVGLCYDKKVTTLFLEFDCMGIISVTACMTFSTITNDLRTFSTYQNYVQTLCGMYISRRNKQKGIANKVRIQPKKQLLGNLKSLWCSYKIYLSYLASNKL